MSRKDLEEEAENHEWSPDLGSVLKMAGEVILAQWHEKNGIYLNSEERKERGKRPQAEVHQSDIQIRNGNQLITFVPVDEDKAMISIPVGMSDKATPASIPKEWCLGMWIDGMIEAFEGDETVVRYFANGMNSALNNATEIDDEGKLKINRKKLPEFNNPIAVAEIMDSFKRTFVSKSKPSTKANFTMVVQELEPVAEAVEVVEPEPEPSKADLVMGLADRLASHSTPQEEQVVGEDSHSNTEPVHALEEAETPTPPADDAEEVVAVVADPTPPVDENPHNFKKNPTDWIKHELMHYNKALGEESWNADEVAEVAGCHVQTIKRALDKFEAEAAYVHMQGLHTLKDADEGTPGWVALDVDINEDWILRIECERSPTGRYARGRPIWFYVMDKSFPDQHHPTAEETAEMVAGFLEKDWNTHPEEMAERMDAYTAELEAIEGDAEEEAPSLKAADNTDPSLSPCPDCGSLTSPNDVPKEAPDFICGDCHLVRLDEDEAWAEESAVRAQMNSIYDGTASDVNNAPEPEPVDEMEEPAPDPYDFPPEPVAEVIDTPVAAIEKATGRCVHCASPSTFTANTTIGERLFCTEKCWAKYTGNPVHEEGWYGFKASHDEEVEMELEAEAEQIRTENEYDLGNAMGF